VKELEAEIIELRLQLDEKVNNSAQMKSMQKILKDKNQIIEELRSKLA
jgi:hypothetical protein